MQRMKTFLLATVIALWLALFTVLPITVHADGGDTTLIHACAAKDGTMRIVSATTTCKGSETPLHWVNVARVSAIETKNTTQDTAISGVQSKNTTQDSAILSLQTKDTSQDAAIAAAGGGSNGIVVKDSLGQVIGRHVNEGGVFRLVGNNPLILSVGRQGFTFTSQRFEYTTTDCTGTPYIFSSPLANSLFTHVGTVDGQTGYYADLPTQNLTINSAGFLPDPIADCFTFSTPSIESVASVVTIDLAVFTPPFHAE